MPLSLSFFGGDNCFINFLLTYSLNSVRNPLEKAKKMG